MFSVKKWVDRWRYEQAAQLVKELEEELESARRARQHEREHGAVAKKKTAKMELLLALGLAAVLLGLLGLYLLWPSRATLWFVGAAAGATSAGFALFWSKRSADRWKREQLAQLVDELDQEHERQRRVRELRP